MLAVIALGTVTMNRVALIPPKPNLTEHAVTAEMTVANTNYVFLDRKSKLQQVFANDLLSLPLQFLHVPIDAHETAAQPISPFLGKPDHPVAGELRRVRKERGHLVAQYGS
ncbi:hypothetical protein NUW58_g9768 [Xylaria curta]|uniref:Uncharacterized protein n=1 Tax=Xylaria curta TaxID=42375 RepID=A0ACC1MTZ0_9PEZI|nr:hypothetical protein NUW58_g9768 [Xylaria curta]